MTKRATRVCARRVARYDSGGVMRRVRFAGRVSPWQGQQVTRKSEINPPCAWVRMGHWGYPRICMQYRPQFYFFGVIGVYKNVRH